MPRHGSILVTSQSQSLAPLLTFRAGLSADVAAIVTLVDSAYRGDSSRRGWTTEAELLDGQRTDPDEVAGLVGRAPTEGRVLLTERDGRLLACCYLERQENACYLGMFSVDPNLQGGRIGRSVLVEAERIAREEWSCTEMKMTVIDVRHELLAWYTRRGYERTGEHKPFPYGDPRSGIPKRDDLRFEVMRKTL